MSLISVIVIGFLVGLVARLLMPGHDPAGFLLTVALGIAGALVMSYLGQAMGLYATGEPASFLGAVLGAVIILALGRFVGRRRHA